MSHHKLIVVAGIILGTVFSYCIKTIGNIWTIIIYLLCSIYIDYFCLNIITKFIIEKYFISPLTQNEKDGLHFLIILAMPTILCMITKK